MFNRHHIPASLRRRKRIRRYVLLLFFVLLIGVAVYVVFFTSLFKVREVIVEGNRSIPDGEIVDVRKIDYMFWPVELLEIPPVISKVEVTKDYLDRTVTVLVEERQEEAIWCYDPASLTQGELTEEGELVGFFVPDEPQGMLVECAWIDGEGYVLRPAPVPSGLLIPVIYGPYAVKPGEFVIREGLRSHMEAVIKILDETDLEVSHLKIDNLHQEEVTAFLVSGTSLHFSLRFDPYLTSGALDSLKEKLPNLEYVDLRSENRAYYKER